METSGSAGTCRSRRREENQNSSRFERHLIGSILLGAFVLVSIGVQSAEPRVTRRAEPFIVHDTRPRLGRPLAFTPKDPSRFVKLNADVLAGSAERIKEAVYRELGLPGHRGGKIHLFLKTATEPDQEISIASAFYADGWQYHLLVPDQVGRTNLVRALVQVVLLEFANRGAGPKSAEIPLWLSDGLSYDLLASVGPDLILEASPVRLLAQYVLNTPVGDVRVWVTPAEKQTRNILAFVGVDALRESRQFFRHNEVLTFSELANPAAIQLTDEKITAFQYSSQLFVHELRRIPGGRIALISFLRTLPHYWNWQVAFLNVYQSRFPRLLDVEKWWSVTITAVTGRDPTQVWPAEVCLEKLDEILLSAAQVNLVADALPVRTQVTLYQVIVDWDLSAQKVALERVMANLSALRVNSPKDLIPLVDAYRTCLRTYLLRRFDYASSGGGRIPMAAPARLVVQQTVQELDELFRQRETLRRAQLSADSQVAITK